MNNLDINTTNIDETTSIFKGNILKGSPEVKVFAEKSIEPIKEKLFDELLNPGITLGISGGGFFSVMSYEIIDYLLHQGLKIDDIIGNSGGALVGALVATHNVKKEYIDNVFSHIKMKPIEMFRISNTVVGIMAPFLIEYSYGGQPLDLKDILIKNTDLLLKEFSHGNIFQNGKVSEENIKRAVSKIIAQEKIFPQDSSEEIEKKLGIKKITFLDVKNMYGMDFSVLATAIKGKNIFKQGKKVLTDITLTGDFPVIDALVVSSSGPIPKKLNVRGTSVLLMDGYMSGANFPHSKKHYPAHDSNKPIVLIETDDDSPDNLHLQKSGKYNTFGENTYIISPNLHKERPENKRLRNFNSDNINVYKKIAKEYIDGSNAE
ncbi:MAG: hypothetical protein NT085_02495 [candidate division SR1 bacterium]|nr:hypothetical protein [candidate division SR1 bacterium]